MNKKVALIHAVVHWKDKEKNLAGLEQRFDRFFQETS
jgi:hypothetical protein